MKKIKNCVGDVLWAGEALSTREAVMRAISNGADLRYANLEGVDFWDTVFYDVDFTGANLRDACFCLVHFRFFGRRVS